MTTDRHSTLSCASTDFINFSPPESISLEKPDPVCTIEILPIVETTERQPSPAELCAHKWKVGIWCFNLFIWSLGSLLYFLSGEPMAPVTFWLCITLAVIVCLQMALETWWLPHLPKRAMMCLMCAHLAITIAALTVDTVRVHKHKK